MSGSLGGPLQTVPRAELKAVIKALKAIPGDMTLWSDCKYVVGGFPNIDGPLPKLNRSLWIEARKLLSERKTDFAIFKVLAHATHKDVGDGKLSAWERLRKNRAKLWLK